MNVFLIFFYHFVHTLIIHTTNIFKFQKVQKDIVKAIHTGGNDRI